MVQRVKTNSSNELYNNANDPQRVYDIEANVNIAEAKTRNMDSGSIRKNGELVGQFNWWEDDNLNITYQGVSVTERNEINIAVDAFINEVKVAVKQ